MLAEADLRNAYNVFEQQTPYADVSVETLGMLGQLAIRKGEWQNARNAYLHAEDILKRNAPENFAMINVQTELGEIALHNDDLRSARQYFERALALGRKVPDSIEMAVALHNLGQLAEQEGDLRQAEANAKEAWNIVRKLSTAFNSDEEANHL